MIEHGSTGIDSSEIDIYARFGARTVINARGTVTRLSGARMSGEVVEAISTACEKPVVVEELHAAACRHISQICSTEAALVTSGAAAALMLGTAAILARWDLARIERLPDTSGMPNEFLIARAHRNGYDHAVRAAGGRLIEVGMDEVRSGAGVRRTEAWEYDLAVTPNTVGVLYVLTRDSRPPLPDVVAMAHARSLPVLVDAAAQLPPVENLRAICATGANLVCFSGGKAIGGPQASGILCGRRELVGSAFLQMMDHDELPQHWFPPVEFIDRDRIPAAPRHGIGRMLKVGKEQIIGLLAALDQFTESSNRERIALRLSWLIQIRHALSESSIEAKLSESPKPILEIPIAESRFRTTAMDLCLKLRAGSPPIYVNHSRLTEGTIIIEPSCLAADEIPHLIRRLIDVLK